jgi:4-aminobutyrate aminotransferase-like enzyme
MASGFPISACIGRAEVMDAWPVSQGESLHTSTFLGHPTACAAALASISEIERLGLVARSATSGAALGEMLKALAEKVGPCVGDVRGCGLMWGIELVGDDGAPDQARASKTVTEALRRGVVVLAGGPGNNVLSLSPPLVIATEQLAFGVEKIGESLA